MTRSELIQFVEANIYPNGRNQITAPMVRDSILATIDFMGDAAVCDIGLVAQGNLGLVTGASVYSAINTAIASAIKFQGVTSTALTDGSTTNPILIDGESYTAKKGDVVLYGGKEFLWTGSAWEQLGDEASWALKTITISAGTGLVGGGDLSANRTISLSQDSIDKLALANTAIQSADVSGLTLKMNRVGTTDASIGTYNPLSGSATTLTITSTNIYDAIGSTKYHVYGGDTSLNTFKIGGATLTWHPAVGTTPGYLELNSAFLTTGDQIVGSGTPGGGGGGAGYLYELKDTISTWTGKPSVSATQVLVFDPQATDKESSTGAWKYVPATDIGRVYSGGTGITINGNEISVTANTYAPYNSAGYLPLSGGILSANNQWLSPAKLQLMRADTTAYTDRACIGVTDGNLHLDSYPNKTIYLNYYSGSTDIRIGGGQGVGPYIVYHTGNLSPITTSNYSSYCLPLAGGIMTGPIGLNSSGFPSGDGKIFGGSGEILFKASGGIKLYDTAWRTIYHSGNSNKSDVAWACSTLTASGAVSISANAAPLLSLQRASTASGCAIDMFPDNQTAYGWRLVAERSSIEKTFSFYAVSSTSTYTKALMVSPSGLLSVFPSTTNSYNEGIRIHAANDAASVLMLCGADNTGDSGTSTNSWGFFNSGGNFYVNRNAATGSSGYILCNVGGNWGFGTASPAYKLDVAGTARFGALTPKDGVGVIPFAVANAGYSGWVASFGTDAGGVVIGYKDKTGATLPCIGTSTATDLMMLPDGGRFLIGGSYAPGSAWTAGTTVIGKDGSDKIIAGYLSGSSYNFAVIAAHNSALSGWANLWIGANTQINFYFRNVVKAYITSGGALVTTGDQVISSDERLKTIVKPVDMTVEQLAGMRAVIYDRKDSGVRSLGVIAQDWEKVLPESVNQGEYLTFKYAQTAMVSAIVLAKHETEQDKEIRELREKVQKLEEDNLRLKARLGLEN